MRQMLIRVPDDLHTRLSARAKSAGVSVNALVNEVLDAAVPHPPGSRDGVIARRDRLRDKARDLGILVESPAAPVTSERFNAALKSTEGVGPIIDELWSEGR
ncbi:MAG TPA: toxin-antitoxin system HicB family antitoxin [Jiangellaceae bacterium]